MKNNLKLTMALVLGSLLVTSGCMADKTPSVPASENTASESAPSKVRTDVKDFTLKDSSGNTVSLSGALAKNKAVLINFFATWCPPCNEEIPDLIRLQERYSSKGFTVLGVDIGESQSKVAKFIQKKGINYPVVLDQNQKVAQDYEVVGIPTSILMDGTGRIIGTFHAAGEDLFSAVDQQVRY